MKGLLRQRMKEGTSDEHRKGRKFLHEGIVSGVDGKLGISASLHQ